jgi:hypothetical protein
MKEERKLGFDVNNLCISINKNSEELRYKVKQNISIIHLSLDEEIKQLMTSILVPNFVS